MKRSRPLGTILENWKLLRPAATRVPTWRGALLVLAACAALTAGFIGKYLVFAAGVNAGLVPLVVVAVLTSVAGVYYYLRVVKLMYFDAPRDAEPLQASAALRAMLSVNGLAVLVLGLFPGALAAVAWASATALPFVR